MAEEDELRKQQRVTILTPALIAILGLLGAAIAPAVQFVNGYWQNKLKEQEIAHLIVLDFAKLAINEKASREYRLDTLKVIASIEGNPLQGWAIKSMNEKQSERQELMAALRARPPQPSRRSRSARLTWIARSLYTEPGEGPRFKGRGLLLLTGRSNYAAFANYVGRPEIMTRPEIVATEPGLAVETALWFWERARLNKLADNDDVVAVTRRLIGGLIGLDDRRRLYETGKQLL